MNLATSRGASETVQVRMLREGVAQIKQALEIAIVQTQGEARGEGRAATKERRGEIAADDAVEAT